MKILGLDPGLAKVGWGIIETGTESNPRFVECGCISTSKTESIVGRLAHIYDKVSSLVAEYLPDEVAIEKIFFSVNTKTAIDVAQARGAILIALNHSEITVSEYTPLQIKQALTGYGRARKEQVMFMVKNFLKLESMPATDHAADALAAAICHESSRKIARALKGAR
jgi:crossover junction endodeoxyribonuclease RuvC